jgi:hypothetical protein
MPSSGHDDETRYRISHVLVCMKSLCLNDRSAKRHSLSADDLTAQAFRLHDTSLSMMWPACKTLRFTHGSLAHAVINGGA